MIQGHKSTAQQDYKIAVAARLDQYTQELSDALVGALMPHVEAAYWRWYDHGGSLNEVGGRVEAICQKFRQTEAQPIVSRSWGTLNVDLVRLMREHLARFLTEHEIPKDVSKYIPASVASVSDLQPGANETGKRIVDGVGNLAGLATAIATITLLIVAAIKIKIIAVVVLAASTNPLLAAALGIGALVAGYFVGKPVKDVVENAVRSHDFNRLTLPLLHVALWKSKLAAELGMARLEAKTRLLQTIRQSTRELDPTLLADLPTGQTPPRPLEALALETFGDIIDAAIKDLNVLEPVRLDAPAATSAPN